MLSLPQLHEYLKEVCTRMCPKLGTVYCLMELVFCQKELFCLDTALNMVMFFLLLVYIWMQGTVDSCPQSLSNGVSILPKGTTILS